MTNIFAVVGEHRDDPDRLLVIGEDGNAYDYKVPTGQFMPTEPQEEDWHVDTEEPDLEEIFFDGSQLICECDIIVLNGWLLHQFRCRLGTL